MITTRENSVVITQNNMIKKSKPKLVPMKALKLCKTDRDISTKPSPNCSSPFPPCCWSSIHHVT